jgi:hypothetical protein
VAPRLLRPAPAVRTRAIATAITHTRSLGARVVAPRARATRDHTPCAGLVVIALRAGVGTVGGAL